MDASFPPQPAPFKEMSTWLKVFGVLTILLGMMFGLFVLFIVGIALWEASAMAAEGGSVVELVPGILMYGGMAVACIWLGVGSMLARRWARTLLLVGASICLVIGVIAFTTMIFVLPPVMKAAFAQQNAGTPGGAEIFVMVFMALFFAFFGIVIPGTWAFFYSRKSVKATCEARNPNPSWTDACPAPVLAVSLISLGLAPSFFFSPLMAPSVLPFFGLFVTGPIAAIFIILLGFLFLWFAWGFYKLQPAAWWTYLILILLAFVSNTITYSLHNLIEVYRLMNYSEERIKTLENMPIFQGYFMILLFVVTMLPMLGYLIYLRRFFTERPKAF